LTDRKSRNDDDCEGARCRREHPVGDLIESALWLSDQEVVDAAMLVIANHQHRLPSERMKRIGDNGFECQKPGIMAPARTKAAKTGPAWHRSSRPPYAAVGIVRFMPRAELCRTGSFFPEATVTWI
jgi:hypothetical protein